MYRNLAIIFILSLLTGCSTTRFMSDVVSMADESVTGCCTFAIVPGNENVDQSSLAWRRFEGQLAKSLEMQGYRRVSGDKVPDIGIIAVTGIGDPRDFNYSAPIWGQTGTKTTGSRTTGSATVFGNSATVNTNTTYQTQPTYGVVGTAQGTRTVYDRYLALHAYSMKDKAPNGDYLEAWSTVVRSTGSTGELSVVLPYMIASAQPYFGKNLTKQKRVTIYENSKKVQSLIE